MPVKTPDRETFDRSSGTESDDSSIERSVRFNKLAEVRHMSENEAAEALLARLSYQASVRMGELAKRAATKLAIYKVLHISLIFCFLVRSPYRSGFFVIFAFFSGLLLIIHSKLLWQKLKLVW